MMLVILDGSGDIIDTPSKGRQFADPVFAIILHRFRRIESRRQHTGVNPKALRFDHHRLLRACFENQSLRAL